MRVRFGLTVLLVASLAESVFGSDTTSRTYGQLPLSFEANQGQIDLEVKFLSRGLGYGLFLTATEAVLSFRGGEESLTSNIRMKLIGANPRACITGQEQQPGKSNYFIGSDPSMWRTDIAHFGQVRYESVYPGVDLLYYGTKQSQLEFDFVVAPGVNPGAILFSLEGCETVHLDATGTLVLITKDGKVRLNQPIVYQEIAGGRRSIAGRYVLVADKLVTFEIDSYDHREPLIIDPVLSYSTYLGGSDGDVGHGISVDSAGNAYITGGTWSVDFPRTIPIANRGMSDVFVTKINPTGTGLVYSTYIGGSEREAAIDIAVDISGNAYVVGGTSSTDYPTANPFQASGGGFYQDAFVTKLGTTGLIIYSSYLGGSFEDNAWGIAIDDLGSAYVSGQSESLDFPTVNPLQPAYGGGGSDLFVTKIHPSGASLIYSTFLGGSGDEFTRNGIAVDALGSAYVTGGTQSTDFPLSAPLQAAHANPGGADAFVSKLTAAGDGLIYSTYLGGSDGDSGADIEVDAAGQAYLVGSTRSVDFPVRGPFQAMMAGSDDAFVAVLDAAGSALITASYLGGSDIDAGNGIALDGTGSIFVTGWTKSGDFPSVDGFQIALGGIEDAFAAKIDSSGSALLYSSFLGGGGSESGSHIAVGVDGSAYIVGTTDSVDYPIKNPYQNALRGRTDAFVTKIGPCSTPPIADAGGNASICEGETTTLDAVASTPCAGTSLEYRWLEAATVVLGCDWSATTICDVTPSTTTAYTLEVRCLGGNPVCVTTDDVLAVVMVEPDLVPPDIGNAIRAVEFGLDVAISWPSAVNARTYNLYRGTSKESWPPPLLTNLTAITETLPDVPLPDSFFYRVTGSSCSGMEGP